MAALRGDANLRLTDLAPAPDGGFVAVGVIWPADHNMQAWMITSDQGGALEWKRTYGGKNMELAHSVVSLRDGTYPLAGVTRSFGFDLNGFVIHADHDGSVLWQKYLGVDGTDTILAAAEGPDGTLAVAGETESFEGGFPGWWMAALAPDGSRSWSVMLHRDYYDLFHALGTTLDGGWILLGDTGTSLDGAWETTAVSLNADGKVVSDLLFDVGGGLLGCLAGGRRRRRPRLLFPGRKREVHGDSEVQPGGGHTDGLVVGGGRACTPAAWAEGAFLLGGQDSDSRGWFGRLMRVGPDGDVFWSYLYDAVHAIDRVIVTTSGSIVALGRTDEPHSD